MQHVPAERLAAIADDEPTAAEALHLASCAQCARERRAFQELVASARIQRDHSGTPLTDWTALSAKLASEGLVSQPVAARGSLGTWGRLGMLAASLLLLAGAAVGGRISAGASPLPLPGARAQSGAQQTGAAEFSSSAEALSVYLRAQRDLQRSAAFLEASNQSNSVEAPRTALATRLAALAEMRAASMAALRDAPTDPVLNNYYVSTLNAYNSTMRQISQITPGGTRFVRY